VRALKRVCRTVDREAEVRGNVFVAPSTPATSPTANVEFVVSGESRAQQLSLADPPDLGLDAISVFDARCAELYIDSQNAVAYVPSALLLLARLAATQDQMRGDLQTEVQRLSRQRPTFPEFDAQSAVKTFLDGLSSTTDPEDARQLASLSDQEQSRLTELRAVLASAAARSVRADAEAARQDAAQARALAGQLRGLGARVEPSAVEALRGHASEADAAEQAVELSAREFAGLPVSGVGSDPWRRLWQAARDFSEQSGSAFPPAAAARCPLCLQEMSADATDRLVHFEQHVRSAVGDQARRASHALDAALERLDERHVQECRTHFLTGLAERESELHEELERFLDAVGSRMRVLREDPAGAQVVPVLLDPAAKLDAWASAREAHAQTLTAAEDPEREHELRQELIELEAREKLSGRLDDVTAWIGTLKRVAALRRAHSALATNRITIKQRELSEAVVTGTLDAKLREELHNLRCEHLPVDLRPHTAVGETQVGLRLAGAHGAPQVSDIASEGEQRALSLSFFLSEVASSEDDGGIVVDDPVSSLDDERRAYIAERLVGEAQRRQVIVLTHDLPFMLDLVEQAENAGIEPKVQGVWRLGSEVGRVDDHPPFKAMNLRQRVGVLDQRVARWDNQPAPADFDEAWRRVSGFYADLRVTWERAVEERLFRGVVQRFQREVKTLALDDVVVTPELVAAVKVGMTRCSQFVHDEPPGASTSLPGRTDLAVDLGKLQEFERQTRS
jgi:recombinational DNA repair ATPase RecF